MVRKDRRFNTDYEFLVQRFVEKIDGIINVCQNAASTTLNINIKDLVFSNKNSSVRLRVVRQRLP